MFCRRVVTKVQRYWPVALSSVCLVVAAYFALTDTAYRLTGCPVETHPEAGFLFIVLPAAFVALILAVRGGVAEVSSQSRKKSLVGSLALSLICVGLTLALIWPTGSSCS